VAVDFQRLRSLSLAPDRPNVILMARIATARRKSMVLVGDSRPCRQPAARVAVGGGGRPVRPQAGRAHRAAAGGGLHPFFIAGVWRDYARSSGAIQMPLADYRALTGDMDVSDAALSLAKDATGEQLRSAKPCPSAPAGSVEPSAIRAMSLQIFDRSFAVTYLLEAIAIVIGLFGVAATFSAQTWRAPRIRHAAPRGRDAQADAVHPGAGRRRADGAGHRHRFHAGPPDQLCAGLHRQSAIVPLDHAAAPALAPDRHRGRRPADGCRLTALVAGRQALSAGPIRAVREDW
jgi:putative ABC transport system permease protein